MTEHDHSKAYGIIGIHQHKIACIVGVYPEERQKEQMLIVDLKVKIDFFNCLHSGKVEDTINYVLLAKMCTQLAQEKKYLLLETFASDIVDHCILHLKVVWAWVRIQKPSAIPTAEDAYIEFERWEDVHVDTCNRGS